VIWRWDAAPDAAGEAADREAAGRARRRGILQACAGFGVGAVVLLLASRTAGFLVLAIASSILLAALISPSGLFAGIERLFRALGRALGRVLTWVLLVPLFYLVFLPFGRLLRRGRRDRLKRFYEPDAPSYWEPLEGVTAPSASMERQY
jgi:hypothetical protein